MTRILDENPAGGGTRILILGAGTYPNAQVARPRAPQLPDIASAAKSAVDLALRLLGPWADRFARPIASIDLLANAPGSPTGVNLSVYGGPDLQVEAPRLAAIRQAKTLWLDQAGSGDILLFYCCGHGFWIPSLAGRTFLASDFPSDPEDPWLSAIALDDFRFALGERAPRSQWLMFDCCANTPTQALRVMSPRPTALLTAESGARERAAELWGDLEQVVLAASTVGAQAFGKEGRGSRFMEVFLEACEGSAFLTEENGVWWADRQTIERSMATYARRVASAGEERYFEFPQVSETDAKTVPRLLKRDTPSECTFMGRSDPSYRLAEASLSLSCPPDPTVLCAQAAGGEAIFRHPVPSWNVYALTAMFPEAPRSLSKRALPPMTEVVF